MQFKFRYVLAAVGLTYGGFRIYDRKNLAEAKRAVFALTEPRALEPIGVYERPRKILVLYHTRLGGKDDWKDFVKPVLDSAALDYHVEAVKEFGQATKIASEIEKDEKEGPFDGILAMGNDIFIETLSGLLSSNVPQEICYVERRESGGFLKKIWRHFTHCQTWNLMSKPALALVLEKKQPLTKDKLPSISSFDPKELDEETVVKVKEAYQGIQNANLSSLSFYSINELPKIEKIEKID